MDTKAAASISKSNIPEESANNKGGFTREIPTEGIALLRFRDYIEAGFQKSIKNPSWTPAIDCIFTFELVHPKHLIEPAGKPPFPQTLTMHVPKATKTGSMYMSLFNAMNVSGEHENFGTMLGDAYLAEIFHNKSADGKTTYANLNNSDKMWSMKAPRIVSLNEAMEEVVSEIPVPEMFGEARLFYWEEAGWTDELMEEAWNTLFIDGQQEDGRSNNFLQDRIISSETYTGSRIETIVTNGTMNLPKELTGDLDAQAANQAPTNEKQPPKVSAEEQALADLGL